MKEVSWKRGGVAYFIPKTKNRIAVPVLFATAGPAVTFIPVFPKPITKSLTVTFSPIANDGIILLFVLPRKMSFPSRLMDQLILVTFVAPMFFISAETPNPPLIVMESSVGGVGVYSTAILRSHAP